VGIAVTVAACLATSAAYAAVYKCKDSAGKIQYSGQPCDYEGKTLGLSDNVIQGERPPSQVDGDGSRSRNNNQASGSGVDPTSARCVEISEELHKLALKDNSRNIVAAAADRGKFKRLSKEYELVCVGVDSTDDAGTRPKPKPKPGPATPINPYIDEPSTRCPDGNYVRGTMCQPCADGSYVASGSGCRLTPDGRYIEGGKFMNRCPDGSYVAGSCTLGPGGKWYGN
jgi:hypothetical protein